MVSRIVPFQSPINFAYFMQAQCLTLTIRSHVILRCLSQSCGNLTKTPELCWRNADDTPKNLREMTGAGVADLEADIDEAA